MSQKEFLPVKFCFIGFTVNDHPSLSGKVVEDPDVVVSSEKVNWYPAIANFSYGTENAHKTLRSNFTIVEPEIKNVT